MTSKIIQEITSGLAVDDRIFEGKEVEVLAFLGKGTMSARYLVKIEGLTYFMKGYQSSLDCAGSTSRNIIHNELAVEKMLHDAKLERHYQGAIEVGNSPYLLFEYFGDSFSLNYHLQVKKPADDLLTLSKKLGVIAENVKSFSLEEVIDIWSKLCTKVKELHAISFGDVKGIIHMDITPENVGISQIGGETQVILTDLGIARRKGQELKKLFNEVVPGYVGGGYYGAGNGPLHNKGYSPPELSLNQIATAEPYIDCYNVANLLCLMVTGRLSEYWRFQGLGQDVQERWNAAAQDWSLKTPSNKIELEEQEKKVLELMYVVPKATLESILTTGIVKASPKYQGKEIPSTLAQQLANMVIMGTSKGKVNNIEELCTSLVALHLDPPKTKRPIPITCQIPGEIKDYPFSLPPLQDLYQSDIDRKEALLSSLATYNNSTLPREDLLNGFSRAVLERKRADEGWKERKRILIAGVILTALGVAGSVGIEYLVKSFMGDEEKQQQVEIPASLSIENSPPEKKKPYASPLKNKKP